MGSEKDINNNILDDDALETVAGGMGDVKNLVHTKETQSTVSNALQKGKAPKTSNLVLDEKRSKRSKSSSPLFSGDVIDKGTYC